MDAEDGDTQGATARFIGQGEPETNKLNSLKRKTGAPRFTLVWTATIREVIRRDLEDFLKRDRELFELPPLAEPVPDSSTPAPDLAPSSPELPPLRGWTPERLPDGDWGARHPAPGKLPTDLEGAAIEIKTRGGTLIHTVVEVLHRDSESVLVRDTGKSSSA